MLTYINHKGDAKMEKWIQEIDHYVHDAKEQLREFIGKGYKHSTHAEILNTLALTELINELCELKKYEIEHHHNGNNNRRERMHDENNEHHDNPRMR
jgi:hypothetical protein